MEMRGHGLPHLGTGAVLDVAISQDGVLGCTASDDFSVKIWDLDQQQCVKTCKGHSGWVVSVRVSLSSSNAAAFVIFFCNMLGQCLAAEAAGSK
jgi:WD40 repeat protein